MIHQCGYRYQERWNRVICYKYVSFLHVLLSSTVVLPHMRKARKGYVINISSTSGIRGIPCMEFYTGSKFALEGITDSMRYSLSPYNIAVTNINAGPVRTSFTDRFGFSDKVSFYVRWLLIYEIHFQYFVNSLVFFGLEILVHFTSTLKVSVHVKSCVLILLMFGLYS